jgi:hypothetical protein
MAIVTVRLDEKLRNKMKKLRSVNWSEVIRSAIVERISLEESLPARRPIDVALLQKAIRDQDRLRAKTSGTWSGAEEIRKWRELRR